MVDFRSQLLSMLCFNIYIYVPNSGKDERDAKSVEEVESWLASAETKEKLQKIVGTIKNRKCVYVASETALVRRHVADMIRALGVEADYFMLSGVTHPVGNNKGRHYNVKDLHVRIGKGLSSACMKMKMHSILLKHSIIIFNFEALTYLLSFLVCLQ
jgi:hypothetical protein